MTSIHSSNNSTLSTISGDPGLRPGILVYGPGTDAHPFAGSKPRKLVIHGFPFGSSDCPSHYAQACMCEKCVTSRALSSSEENRAGLSLVDQTSSINNGIRHDNCHPLDQILLGHIVTTSGDVIPYVSSMEKSHWMSNVQDVFEIRVTMLLGIRNGVPILYTMGNCCRQPERSRLFDIVPRLVWDWNSVDMLVTFQDVDSGETNTVAIKPATYYNSEPPCRYGKPELNV